jgi:hypothetical protein
VTTVEQFVNDHSVRCRAGDICDECIVGTWWCFEGATFLAFTSIVLITISVRVTIAQPGPVELLGTILPYTERERTLTENAKHDLQANQYG